MQWAYNLSGSATAHAVKRWKPNPDGYRLRPYVTLCGRAGEAEVTYDDMPVAARPCPRCQKRVVVAENDAL